MLLAAGIVLACLTAILAIPVNLTFSVYKHESWQWSVVLCWLFGLLRVPVPSARTRPEELKRRRRGRRNIRAFFGARHRVRPILRSKGFMKCIVKLVKDLVRTVHVCRLGVHARLGLDDPADTGRLWGVVGPLTALMSHSRSVDVEILPEFTAETFDLDSEGHIRFVPLQILFVTATFLISPSTLRAVLAMAAGEGK